MESKDCDANWPTHFSSNGCWLQYIEDEDAIDNAKKWDVDIPMMD